MSNFNVTVNWHHIHIPPKEGLVTVNIHNKTKLTVFPDPKKHEKEIAIYS